MSTEDNKAAVRQFYEEGFNKHNLSAILTFIDPNEVDHFAPPGTPGGIEGARKLIGMFLRAFPDIHVTVEDMIAEGDKVVSRITMSGTQQGAFLGIPPTGKHISITLIEIDRIVGGKSVEHWAKTNLLDVLQQLGVIPALSGFLFLAGLATGMGLRVLLRKVLIDTYKTRRLGLKEETIRTYIREGLLSAYRFGNVLRIRVDDFEKFVQERKIRRDEE